MTPAERARYNVSISRPGEETGIEELRRIVRVCSDTQESAFDGFTAEQIIYMVRACWASPWDIRPDDLTPEERDFAALFAHLSGDALARLEAELG